MNWRIAWALAGLSANCVTWAGDLVGRVTDAQTGQGILRARVVIASTWPYRSMQDYANGKESSLLVVLTDAEGNFACRNLPAGKMWVEAIRVGYLPGDSSVAPTDSMAMVNVSDDGTPATAALRLTRQAVIRGRVIDDSGNVVGGSLALTYPPAGANTHPRTTVSVDRTGEFRIADLKAGSYRLSIGATQDYPPQEFSTSIEVGAGMETEIEFQLKKTP